MRLTSKQRASNMFRCVIECINEVGLGQSQLQCTEFAGQKSHNVDSRGRRDDNAFDAMDHTICAKLAEVSLVAFSWLKRLILTISIAMMRS